MPRMWRTLLRDRSPDFSSKQALGRPRNDEKKAMTERFAASSTGGAAILTLSAPL